MRWFSLKIFTLSGIGIELDLSFLLFLLLFIIFDLAFLPVLLILFLSIALHEISHSLVAQRMGVKVRKIILLPIGGIAAMEESDLSPFEEFKMAIAGPMFNFAVCLLFVGVVTVFGLDTMFYGWADWGLAIEGAVDMMAMPYSYAALLFSSIFWLNYILAIFNLFIPAIPLDGGRVFRSVLAMVTNHVQATRIASLVSKVLVFFMFMFAILSSNWILMIICVFIYIGANAELEHALSTKLLSHFPLKKLVRKEYLIAEPDDTLDKVLDSMIRSKSLIAFTQVGRKIEAIDLYGIRQVPKKKWKSTPIRAISKRLKPIALDHTATYAMRKMINNNHDALPVVHDKKIVGCVFRADIERVFAILKVVNG